MPRYEVLIEQQSAHTHTRLTRGLITVDGYNSETELRANLISDIQKMTAIQEVQLNNLQGPTRIPVIQGWQPLQWSLGVKNIILNVKRLK